MSPVPPAPSALRPPSIRLASDPRSTSSQVATGHGQASTSNTSLSASTVAPLRSSQALTRRATPSASSAHEHGVEFDFKKPLSPSTVRPRSRIVSSASTASAQSLSRSLSRSTSSLLDSPQTVRPVRTLPKPPAGGATPRKKAPLGLGRPPAAGEDTPRSSRRSSGSTARTASASTRTPLRSSTRAPPLATSQLAMRPPPPPSTTATSRTLAVSRRAAVPGSAIPVPGARTVRRPESALSVANPNAQPGAESSLRSAAGSALRRPTPRSASAGASRPGADVSSRLSSRAKQAIVAPQIALSPSPSAGVGLPQHREVKNDAYETPRKWSSTADGPSQEDATPAADLSLSHFSHASFLSPLPPPASAATDLAASLSASTAATPRPKQLALLQQPRRTRPRQSASLEELLRSGLLPGVSPAAGAGADGADEWELLLDEGSSRLMREEILAGDAASGPGGTQAVGTPWRGRVVSLSMSAQRRQSGASPGVGVGARDSPPRQGGEPPGPAPAPAPQAEDRVLLLRQSTSEASALRRQLAALQGELALVRSARDDDADGAHVAALRRELEAARKREVDARDDWARERREMEDEMAELASIAALAPVPVPLPVPAPVSAVDPKQYAALVERQCLLELEVVAERAAAARRAAAEAHRAVEAGARRERAEVKGELAALRALQEGLGLWAL
ncbi:hypothetical protein JCM3770_000724 [Rhodotorula araucariae]